VPRSLCARGPAYFSFQRRELAGSFSSRKSEDTVVKLNVGGLRFWTSASTLTQNGKSMNVLIFFFFFFNFSFVVANLLYYFCMHSFFRLIAPGENFFSALLSHKVPVVKDESGFFFIDRDGRLFEPILNYLRTGTWRIPPGIAT
jgi:hypothetical protein